MKSPVDLKFVFVVGKGGVGKTSISAALALAAAAQGKRVLVAMCNAKERLSYLLETAPIGSHIQPVLPRIDAVNMEPNAALEEYGMLVLRVRALYKVVFENRFVAAFLHGTPGLDAWAMLGKAQYHAREKDADGRDRYDLVIVDAPATGHGLDLLRVPRVIMDVAPPGLLRREAERALELFRDPERSGVLLVTIPEDMPTTETIELHAAIRDELSLPICGLVINQTLKTLFAPDELGLLRQLAPKLTAAEIRPVALASRARAEREEIQRACLDRLERELPMRPVQLPFTLVPDFRKKEVMVLAKALAAGFGKPQ
ncbi:MAG TPA: ArsA-related P-loop ATPase [Polyangiales bacterium]|jgi:anion-transporting  ArsA/GET3 family ATPase|nr:ArsA-related P-loop ATPase [Polyangiales bacterium]